MLPERRRRILGIIVREYISSGVPVGSKYVSKGYSLRVSPATIRHEMASLEEEGYIVRPHISSGGLPSARGYRFYVESLMGEADLEPEERQAIRNSLRGAEGEPDQWARMAVSILTRKLRSFALATPLQSRSCHFRHIDLISIGSLMVMMVVILEEWTVRQRLLGLGVSASQRRLQSIANRMNDLCAGLTYREILQRARGLSGLEEQIVRAVVQVMEAEDKRSREQVYVDGWRYLLDRDESLRSGWVHGLARGLEEGSLLRRLSRGLNEDSRARVIIGEENEEAYLRECTVILTRYGVPGRRGTVGIIGPTRLPYNRAIPVIEYLSEVLSELVTHGSCSER